jgi:lipopolysaccharide/colanic/teichoic acid biosynthesis glycosyltransferase
MEKGAKSDERIPINPLKRGTDVALSAGLLVALAPVLGAIAVAMKADGLLFSEDRGPLLRTEIRITEGRRFEIYKFRFIRQAVLDEEDEIRRRDRQKSLEADALCTRSGRILKKWYLDELPQLFNILKGDMTFVGPRPFPVDDYKSDLAQGDTRKKVIRAGLSGLTQAHKGHMEGTTDYELDHEYINKVRDMTPLEQWRYDMDILWQTVRIFLEGKGI